MKKLLIAGVLLLSTITQAQAELKDEWDVHEAIATATAKSSHQFNPSISNLQLSIAYGAYDYADAYDVALGKRFTAFDTDFFVTGNIGTTGDVYAVGVAITFTFN